jgi:ribosomal protein L6P/L9E
MSRIGKLPINIPEKVEVNTQSQILLLKENLVHYKLKFQT